MTYLMRSTALGAALAALTLGTVSAQTTPASDPALVATPGNVPAKEGAEPSKVPEQLKDPAAADVTVTGHVLEPKSVPPSPERLAKLKVPDGFEVTVFAQDLVNPRMIAVASDGTIYVTRRSVGDVVMLKDADGDGKADGPAEVVATRPDMHGIAIDGDTVYLVTVNDLYRTMRNADGTLGELERIVDDLPDAGQHPNRTIAVGPDGKLYLSVGSTCNACDESSPESATILKIEPDGSSRSIFASGLRNTIGYGFEPTSGKLHGFDHGIDWLGDDEQSEELNLIEEGKTYGWPYVYADGKLNPQDDPPAGITNAEWAEKSTEPKLLYTPHAAPMQMAFYSGGAFPAEMRDDAFVAMRGSWNRKPPSGYEVVRVSFENGEPKSVEPFVSGFLMENGGKWEQMGRLAGMAVAGDGALLLSDDKNGVIYRIAYKGEQQAAASGAAVTAEPPALPPKEKATNELALAVAEAKGGPIDTLSPAFGDGEPIPRKHAREGENISPPIRWGDGPEGTKSFVLLSEDPDAKVPEPPFVHWVVYNIPAEARALPEGVPGAPKLEKPAATLQGVNDAGSIGWAGMNPPVGDPAHRYHFELFALDTTLDLPFGASRDDVLAAMKGHVLSKGEVVGTYKR